MIECDQSVLKTKILHIVHDEKFIDFIYRVFEEANLGNNEFIIFSKNHRLKYIKNTPVSFVAPNYFVNKSFIASLSNYKMVILHYLDDPKLQLLGRADDTVKFVWFGWGSDYYDLITGDIRKLLMPKTLSLWSSSNLYGINSLLINKFKALIKRMMCKNSTKVRLVNRVNFFAPVLYEDYELLKFALPDFKPQYLPWKYGSLEDDLIKGYEKVTISGDNILVGNSASYTNNHLDVFEKLAMIDLSSRKLLCPLNYGDIKYRKLIVNEGQNKFGFSFVPITDFMPIQAYLKLLSTCSIVVMGHVRQQALGNIVIMMYLGAKVFLNKENPIYKFFQNEGAHIFLLDDLLSEYVTRLDVVAINHNRNVLQRHWSREAIFSKTKNLIDTVSAQPICTGYDSCQKG
jgi:hypothetical protein